jgi:hypothetical protein
MRYSLSTTLLLLTAPLPCQVQDLRVAGFIGSAIPDDEWAGETQLDHENAALRFTAPGAGHVLLFAHTTVDTSSAGAAAARGLVELYPFLGPPQASWTTSHEAFDALEGLAILEQHDALVIPPARLQAQLSAFLGAEDDRDEYGPIATGTAPTIAQRAAQWDFGGPTDERQAWSGDWTPPAALNVFDVSQVGGRAVTLAARQWSGAATEVGLAAVRDLIAHEYGYLIHVQAAFVYANAGSGLLNVRFSQSVVMRRHGIRHLTAAVRYEEMGPLRNCQSPFECPGAPTGTYDHVYLGGKQEWLYVQFPHAVANTLAYVETTLGWAELTQVSNPGTATPDIAKYPFPANGISGHAYFVDPFAPSGPLVLQPLYARPMDPYAIWVFAFSPHPQFLRP